MSPDTHSQEMIVTAEPASPPRPTKRARLLARMRRDEGLTTTEYAVGSVAVAGFAGVLLKLLTSDWAMELLKKVIEWAFKGLFG